MLTSIFNKQEGKAQQEEGEESESESSVVEKKATHQHKLYNPFVDSA